jgi:L-gulono-1,4-lactone dehydrogenase
LAGASTTGTHGTGTMLGNVASQIEELEIVDGVGHIHRCSKANNKKLFDAARVSVGALGIISSITLRTIPLFKLRKQIIPYNLNDLLRELPQLTQKYERLQWSFSPYNENSASLIIREEVPYDSPILPTNRGDNHTDEGVKP